MSQTQTHPLILILISGREHSLHSVEQLETQSASGLWMLVSIKEYAFAFRGKKLLLKKISKRPVPILVEPHNNLLIYNFGKRSSKSFRFTSEPSGFITVAHFKNEKQLKGNILRSGEKMVWNMKYIGKKYPTVIFEFQLIKEKTKSDTNNSVDT
jgi:hypothetical protein